MRNVEHICGKDTGYERMNEALLEKRLTSGDLKGQSPFNELRRGGFAAPRRIFAKVSLPPESENSFL
ncbi:MAG: hypothetical protein IJ240_00895, partial [Clostridia bacterium]|nr:hypothetical protein [Clostridia bacterium]